MQHQTSPGIVAVLSAPSKPFCFPIEPIESLTVVIQAGGASRRMGRSKALVEYLGEPLVVRGVRRFAPIAAEVVVTTNEPVEVARALEAAGIAGVRLARDLYEERGALRGIHTALDAAATPYVALIAVDMVDASPLLVAAEHAELAASKSSVAAVLPHVDGGFEPFHAVYRKALALPLVADAAQQGIQRACGWFAADTEVAEVDSSYVAAVIGELDPFANANTPAELDALEHRTFTAS